MRNLVVLQPRWLLNAMRKVICKRHIDDVCHRTRGDGCDALETLMASGRLDAEVALPLLWASEEHDAAERSALLQYMIHFDLCTPIPMSDGCFAVPSLFSRRICEMRAEVGDESRMIKCIHAKTHFNRHNAGYLPRAYFHSLLCRVLAQTEAEYGEEEAFGELGVSSAVCEAFGTVFELRLQPELVPPCIRVTAREHNGEHPDKGDDFPHW